MAISLVPIHTFTYCLASIILLGAFSRFTHGRYTPWFHDYQQYHQPNDDTSTAIIVPYVDLLLGTLVLLRKTRFVATIVADAFMISGMVIQFIARKRWEVDAVMVAVATLAVWEAR